MSKPARISTHRLVASIFGLTWLAGCGGSVGQPTHPVMADGGAAGSTHSAPSDGGSHLGGVGGDSSVAGMGGTTDAHAAHDAGSTTADGASAIDTRAFDKPDAGLSDAAAPAGPAASKCDGTLPLCLSFENGLEGWTQQGSLTIDGVHAYRGTKAAHLHITGQDNDLLVHAAPTNQGNLWGRYFLYTTGSTTQHGALVEAQGSAWNEVGMSAQRFMGNYTGDKVTECNPGIGDGKHCSAEATAGAVIPLNRWVCVEWQMDGGAGKPVVIYVDGKNLNLVPYDSSNPSFPKYDSITMGLDMYHPIDAPFDMWMDEIAWDTARVGCDR